VLLLQIPQISSQAQTFQDVLNQVLNAVDKPFSAHKVKQHLFDVRIIQLALVLQIMFNCTLTNNLLVLVICGYEGILGAENNWFQ
jgi:hypothetical protein